MNITGRVAAEQQIKLAAQVFEYSTESMVITDADNRIISVNQPYTMITGYKEDRPMPKIMPQSKAMRLSFMRQAPGYGE